MRVPELKSQTLVELRLRGRMYARGRFGAPPRAARAGARVVLPMLRTAADELLGAAERRAGARASCRAGCAACCRQLVPLADAEARDMRRMIERLPDKRRSAVEARFEQAKAQLEARGLLELLRDTSAIPPDGLEALGRLYLSAWIDCPFLENERCTIYQRRPMACRQHAVSTPPQQCARPDGRVKRIAPLGRAVNAAIDAAEATQWVPLVLALEHRQRNRTAPWRTAPQWLAEIWRIVTRGEGHVKDEG